MAGRAKAAAHFPAKFSKALCKGMRRQARVDASGMLSTLVLSAVSDKVGEISHIQEPWKKYWDDISGKELNPSLGTAAREEELKVVDEMGVWEVRTLAECLEVTGKKPVKVRWVDVNEATTNHPTSVAESSLGTSTLTNDQICSLQLHHWNVSGTSSRGVRRHMIMVQDVKKAFFYAPITRDIYVELK